MTSSFIPADQDQRTRITSSLDETLFVEAGAGTGKTEALVGRIVTLITEGYARIGNIAAITFTDLAAAELKERVRARLNSVVNDIDQPGVNRQRGRDAIRGFDSASIQNPAWKGESPSTDSYRCHSNDPDAHLATPLDVLEIDCEHS